MVERINRLKELWQNTSKANQRMIIAVAAVTFVLGVVLLYWANSPDYVTLYSGLSPTDAGSITSELEQQNIPYLLTNGGTTIEVPSEDRNQLRVNFAKKGLPSQGPIGYGLLDKAPFGQTQAMQTEMIMRATEGEVEKAIMSMAQVSSASVHFAPGNNSPFVSDQSQPTASVMVNLKPGEQLSSENVQAIVFLTAHSFSGLHSKNVTVVDGNGNLLWDESSASSAVNGASNRFQQQMAYKEQLTKELQQVLNRTLGPGKSVVIVHAELNFDKQDTTTETIQPGAPISDNQTEESLKGGGQLGVPAPAGVTSNLGGAASGGAPTYAASTTQSGTYTRSVSVKNMENSKDVTHTVQAPGKIQKLTVSVLVDKSVPAQDVAAIKPALETAIGVDPTNAARRQVTVEQIAFDHSIQRQEQAAARAAAETSWLEAILSYGVPLLVFLALLLILGKSLKRFVPPQQFALAGATEGRVPLLTSHAGHREAATQSTPALTATPDTFNPAIEEGPQPGTTVTEALAGGGGAVIGLSSGDGIHTFEMIGDAFDANLASIVHLINTKPQTAAMLLKSWLRED
ncbi:MAG: flagellar M-ring protein FliF [Armatimonadetes bacterium]|nr:flagellar M-ring protein FliF [Armatimonadota bacterium]